jgi:thiol-disulfide isomerase/thioredoxin
MKKLLHSEKLNKAVQFLKPWLSAIVIILILRYTGLLAGMSELTGSVMMKTGVMDAGVEKVLKKESFDYNFSIKDMKGNKVDFNQYKGKVVFLNLWATWCGPCRFEMPSIQNLQTSLKDNNDIAFVMLSLDRDEHQSKVINYIHDKEFTFPVFMPTGNLTNQLAVPSIPTTFVIGKDGTIASKKVGTANYDTDKFRKFLKELTQDETAK